MNLNREALGQIFPVFICLLAVTVWLPLFALLRAVLRVVTPARERSCTF